MLAEARKRGLENLIVADGLALPFPDHSVDALTIGYGLRNISNWADAISEFSRVLRPGGLLVVLDHGQGYMSLYAHNEALTVISGDWVDAGEVLARSGTNSSDPNAGLYFEIRRNGEPQDPAVWLRKAPSQL